VNQGGDFLAGDLSSEDQANLPLIQTLRASVAQWSRGQGGELVIGSKGNAGTALSDGGIYAVLKRFFRQAAKSAELVALDSRRFEKALTHWMRHTFVQQALVDVAPIEIASELAGNAFIDTTSIFSTQEMARTIRSCRG
jgi:hypothetical protein